MKSQHISGDGYSVTDPNESNRTIRERVGQAYEAAVMAISGAQNQDHHRGGSSSSISKEIDRRRRWSYHTEDPIRTMMFLGSWSHT